MGRAIEKERDTFCKVPGQACALLLLWLFSLGFPHEFLGFNNPGAFKTACQIPYRQMMTIQTAIGILKVAMGREFSPIFQLSGTCVVRGSRMGFL